MAIGVFDSGVGGLTVHRELTRRFPQRDFVYLADQAHAPYGGRGGEEIVELTKAGCERLFEAGASVVVLACNTASAIALRRLQQTWIPGLRERLGRPVNVLGIIVPTIEAATGLPWSFEAERPQEGEKIQAVDITGVFCTAATAISRVFEIEIDKRREDIAVFCEPCPGLAGLIELGAPVEELTVVVKDHVDALRRRIGRHPDKAILGCTHYEIIAELFAEALPAGTVLIEQPTAVADALDRYFARHPEYALGDSGRRDFLTTGQAGPQSDLIARFWGAPLTFDQA
ncbi:aspartate/glutamate racemase family protein [Brevundimonas sp.]|jgi:glutamate racemase|uniref:glutamate racemase n=1 Tax=Brevundimonas sp. TaxID=1871086 RepID=UPI001A26140C|nr:aspartate/glutamate racemase family protein [Brevundimonas sp.]MBJ7512053.1 aspartate/glutamate racemase family protein [Brevundimonas sp.]